MGEIKIKTTIQDKYARLVNSINSRFYTIVNHRFRKNNFSIIAMFHDILSDEGIIYDDWAMRFNLFRQLIETMIFKGFKFISLDDLLKNWNGKDKVCVLTFDDGYESVYIRVMPFLSEMKIPFTSYITTSFLNKSGYLSKEQLEELSKNSFCTVGMHAHEHLQFRFETPKTLSEDFIKCRSIISEILNKQPEHYAFPYGDFYSVSFSNRKLIKNFEVKSIAMTYQMHLSPSDVINPFSLPRINMPWHIFSI